MDPIERRDLCEFATRCVDDLVDSHLVQKGPGWICAWYDFGLEWSETDPDYVLLAPLRLSQFAKQAREDPDVFDLLTYVCASRLRTGVHIPRPLGEVLGCFLDDPEARPKKKPGPSPIKNWPRNFIIFAVLDELLRQREYLPVGENRDQLGVRARLPRLSEIAAEGIKASRLPNVQAFQIQRIWENKELEAEYLAILEAQNLSLLDEDRKRI